MTYHLLQKQKKATKCWAHWTQGVFFNFTKNHGINDGFHQLHDAANCQVVAWGAEPSVQVSVQVLSWGKLHVKKWCWNPWQNPQDRNQICWCVENLVWIHTVWSSVWYRFQSCIYTLTYSIPKQAQTQTIDLHFTSPLHSFLETKTHALTLPSPTYKQINILR